MKIYLLGAANPETIRMIRAVERSTPHAEFVGLLDNDPKKIGTDFYGLPVVGGITEIPRLIQSHAEEDVRFVNLITGSVRARHETTQQILAAGGALTNFIHPNIDLTMTRLGIGLYLQEAVIIQADVELADNVSIHMGAVIGHESKIGTSTFIAHAVSISGVCDIGEGCFIGTNASILPRVKIGRWATIGAGSVVTRDVPDFAVVVGNPGKVIKYNEYFK